MGPPYSPRPHDGEVPESHEALGIAGRESLVVSEEYGSMYLRLVPAEDVLRDWGGFSHGGVVAAVAGSCYRVLGR